MKCPRGCRSVIRNHDEVVCLIHGTLATPERPWDAVEQASTYTWNYVPYVRITESERREWATWKDGDPIPRWLTANPTVCEICGREMGAQGMPSHVQYVHGNTRREGDSIGTCPCCGRSGMALFDRYTHARPWCKQCARSRHIDGCTRPARSEQDARKRGLVWL